MAALKDQLSQLDRTQGSQFAHEQWQEETQRLRGELAACLKTETDTGAAVAQHATHLSSLEKRLTELYADMRSSAAQVHSASSIKVLCCIAARSYCSAGVAQDLETPLLSCQMLLLCKVLSVLVRSIS